MKNYSFLFLLFSTSFNLNANFKDKLIGLGCAYVAFNKINPDTVVLWRLRLDPEVMQSHLYVKKTQQELQETFLGQFLSPMLGSLQTGCNYIGIKAYKAYWNKRFKPFNIDICIKGSAAFVVYCITRALLDRLKDEKRMNRSRQ